MVIKGVFVLVCVAVAMASPQRTDVDDVSVEIDTGDLSCDGNYELLVNKCYKFHQSPMPWAQAKENCGADGAQLVSVITESQYNALLSHINANYAGTYWTSGSAINGQWVWQATGQSMNPAWWGRSPSTRANTCAYFCSNTNKYWDKSCSNSLRFICEKGQEIQARQSPFRYTYRD